MNGLKNKQMRSKTAQRILDKTPDKIKKKVNDYAEKIINGICLDCGVKMEKRMDEEQKVWWCKLCHNETNRSK